MSSATQEEAEVCVRAFNCSLAACAAHGLLPSCSSGPHMLWCILPLQVALTLPQLAALLQDAQLNKEEQAVCAQHGHIRVCGIF